MQPQTCTKCHSLPQDILMLACSHDLCLNCAADRLAFEMKKKKPANSIVCQFCYERTPLDSESVSELQKIMNSKPSKGMSQDTTAKRSDSKPYERPLESYQKSSRDPLKKPYQADKIYEKAKDRTYDRIGNSNSGINYNGNSTLVVRKLCQEHSQEQILYFCFDCKCQCICPQCVIHGKHKDHQVKTVKKAYPIVKSDLQKTLEKFQTNIEGLLIKKSQIQKNIRVLNQQNTQSKRQIMQAFEQIKAKLDVKQKQILKTCDQSLEEGLEELDKYIKGVMKRIDQMKHQSTITQQVVKKDQITTLNYYSKKWKQLSDQSKQPDVSVSIVTFPSNQLILSSILDLTDQISQIGLSSSVPHNRKY